MSEEKLTTIHFQKFAISINGEEGIKNEERSDDEGHSDKSNVLAVVYCAAGNNKDALLNAA